MTEREEVTVRFSDLRRLASSIPLYLTTQVGVDKTPTLATAIEDDWGMADLDIETLITDFGERYQVDLTSFDFTGLISHGPTIKDTFLFFPLVFLLVLYWVFKVVAALLLLPFNRGQAKRIWKSSATALWGPTRKRDSSNVLTIGDFVASAATGYFVKRERVRFVLVK